MSLYSGYGIETLEGASASIVFSDESILRLDEHSRVNISNPVGANIDVNIERGNIWTRVLKPLFSGDNFTIHSGDVSLGVRGTSLYISKTAVETTVDVVDSYTADSTPSVLLTDASGATQEVAAGKQIVISSSNAVSESDETKSALMQRVPEIRAFTKNDLNYLALLLDDRGGCAK